MERRDFMKGVLGAAAAMPVTIMTAASPAAAQGGSPPVGSAEARLETDLVGWMRTPPVRDLVADYQFNTSDVERHHLNKLILMALGRSDSPRALEHLLRVRAMEGSEQLGRVATIQIYRFERRLQLASTWALLLHR